MLPGAKAPEGTALFVERLCTGPGGDRTLCDGAPCRDKEKAFILAAMSDVSPLARTGGGAGRRAAFIWPKGAEDWVMVLESDPSTGKRSEGGLGGDTQFCGDCVGGNPEASIRLSPSEHCDSAFSDGGVCCASASILAAIYNNGSERYEKVWWGRESYLKPRECKFECQCAHFQIKISSLAMVKGRTCRVLE